MLRGVALGPGGVEGRGGSRPFSQGGGVGGKLRMLLCEWELVLGEEKIAGTC